MNRTDRRYRIALVAMVVIMVASVLCTGGTVLARHYMTVHWGGGNFPPLVGHLAVILSALLLIAANVLAVVSAILAIGLAWFEYGRRGNRRRALAFVITALFAGLLLACQGRLWALM